MAKAVRRRSASEISPRTSSVAWRWLFRAYLLLLLWLPLPLGSNRAWAWALMEISVLLLLITYLFVRQKPPVEQTLLPPLKAPLLLFLVAILYPLWQTMPLAEPLLQILSPHTLATRQWAALHQGGTISLDLHATWVEWLKGIAYGGLFVLTLLLVNSQRRLQMLIWVLLSSGVVQVCISLLLLSLSSNSDVRGSFVNRNHLAGLLELIIPLTVGVLRNISSLSDSSSLERQQSHAWLRFFSSSSGGVAGVMMILWFTLFLTQSRGGNAALIFSFVAVWTLSRLTGMRRQETVKRSNMIYLLLACTFILGGTAGLEILLGRFLDTNLLQEGRLAVLFTGKQIILDYPLFGSGSGTFASIYPRYQPEAIAHLFFDHAHNDHLELLADRGIIGYALLAGTVLTSWHHMLRCYRHSQHPLVRATCYAALVSTISLVIHGIFDFNFQIPANAAYFTVMLALGLRCSRMENSTHPSSPDHMTA
ncbi:MAG: O-antigen ligase family protein [Magnetococcales bacterium]|nr:O-antigen ligase family protein [Magnetococcales bacterium]